jgi:hypothetical protein
MAPEIGDRLVSDRGRQMASIRLHHCSAAVVRVTCERMRSGCSAKSSFANCCIDSASSAAQRKSIQMLHPSAHPSCWRPSRNAATKPSPSGHLRHTPSARRSASRSPPVVRAVVGQAAAPPSNVMNSRRLTRSPRRRGFAPLTDREMRGTLQSREGPARRDWLQLGPSTGSILPLGRRAGSRRAAGTYSSVNDQQCLAAVQAL